jgi:hypothetical protein
MVWIGGLSSVPEGAFRAARWAKTITDLPDDGQSAPCPRYPRERRHGRRNGQALIFDQRFNHPDLNRNTQMTRREHEELQRKLAPTDPLSQERAAQAVEDLEYQLFAGRITAQAIQAGY